MKTLKNKETEVLDKNETKVMFFDFAKTINSTPPEGGYNMNTMKLSLKIDAALEKAKDKIELEDAEADYFKEIVSNYTWAIKHKDVVAFIEAVDKM